MLQDNGPNPNRFPDSISTSAAFTGPETVLKVRIHKRNAKSVRECIWQQKQPGNRLRDVPAVFLVQFELTKSHGKQKCQRWIELWRSRTISDSCPGFLMNGVQQRSHAEIIPIHDALVSFIREKNHGASASLRRSNRDFIPMPESSRPNT